MSLKEFFYWTTIILIRKQIFLWWRWFLSCKYCEIIFTWWNFWLSQVRNKIKCWWTFFFPCLWISHLRFDIYFILCDILCELSCKILCFHFISSAGFHMRLYARFYVKFHVRFYVRCNERYNLLNVPYLTQMVTSVLHFCNPDSRFIKESAFQ